jgi:putative glutamine amidotransferase
MNTTADRLGPRIVITVADPARQSDPTLAERKNELYRAAVERHGGQAVLVDASASGGVRSAAFDSMDGLLLSGGADISPEHYGRGVAGARATEPERDALELAAWKAATARNVPILGICRGFQAINAFSGGTLLQNVEGHAGGAWGNGRPAPTHPLRVAPGTRLARILFPTNVRGGVVTVNSFHHQGVGSGDLAPGLVGNARAASPAGELIEGLEAADGRFIIGVQCHPERTDSTPAAFDRLFRVFVDAARGPADRR